MKTTKIEFTIEPVKDTGESTTDTQSAPSAIDSDPLTTHEVPIPALEDDPSADILYKEYQKIDNPMIQEGVMESMLFQQMPPEEASLTTSQFVTGNLLNHNPAAEILTIEGYPVEDIANAFGVVEMTKQNGEGVLTIYTQAHKHHIPGDFIYSLKSTEAEANQEQFFYEVQTQGQTESLHVQFDISPSSPRVGQPDFGLVDEEGLLPGNHEALETYGNLDVNFAGLEHTSVEFSPIVLQKQLLAAELSSDGIPLYYTLNEDGTTLSATQGANGPQVFSMQLFEDGSYTFSLHAHIDRAIPENLISDPSFSMLGKEYAFVFDKPLGWQVHETDITSLMEAQAIDSETIITQDIHTQLGESYHLSFYLGSPNTGQGTVDIYWNDKLIHQMFENAPWTGYTFALDGGYSQSELKIVGHNLSHPIKDYMHDLLLSSMSMQKLNLDFDFNLCANQDVIDSGHVTIQIATEPPVVLKQPEPYNIVYEQLLYQNIIIEQSTDHESPLTTLDLDGLFEQLNIQQANRQVDIVQLEENGERTNIYEVQISDKTSGLDPITVAGIRLSFDGGDGGLDVFYKNIQIHET